MTTHDSPESLADSAGLRHGRVEALPVWTPTERAAAVQRVERVLAEHDPDLTRENQCRCGAVIHDDSQFRSHVAAEVARAAREDVPALTQQARADELDRLAAEMESAEWDHKDDWGVPVIYPHAVQSRAAAIREGGS